MEKIQISKKKELVAKFYKQKVLLTIFIFCRGCLLSNCLKSRTLKLYISANLYFNCLFVTEVTFHVKAGSRTESRPVHILDLTNDLIQTLHCSQRTFSKLPDLKPS